MNEKVQALIEEIKSLTVLELAGAVKAMGGGSDVSTAAPIVVVGAAPAVGGATGGVERKTGFDIVTIKPGQEKIKVIKVVKDITGLGLKEARTLIGKAPKAVKEGIPQAEANEIKVKLREVGITVEAK